MSFHTSCCHPYCCHICVECTSCCRYDWYAHDPSQDLGTGVSVFCQYDKHQGTVSNMVGTPMHTRTTSACCLHYASEYIIGCRVEWRNYVFETKSLVGRAGTCKVAALKIAAGLAVQESRAVCLLAFQMPALECGTAVRTEIQPTPSLST